MQQIWNDFELKKPPFLTLPTANTKFVVDLHDLIAEYVRKDNAYQEEFYETAALIGRLMARRKNSFRKMKGFKEFCKLNASLCRLLRIDFKRDLDSFRSSLPDVAYDEDVLVHVPTRDNFDFLLICLIAVCELHKRIVECCVESAEYFTMQLRVHYFFEINTLLVAVIAKIYNASIQMGNLAINFYNNLREYCHKFPLNDKSKFAINADDLPIKMEIISKISKEEENLQTVSINDDLIKEIKTMDSSLVVKAKNLKKTDLGTEVQRSKPKKIFDIESLKTIEHIKKFILNETKARINNLNNCLTKRILSHEWSGATKLFERKIQNREDKKAINIFKKFIGSKL